MAPLNTAELVQNLDESQARWTARQTTQSQLSDDGKHALLGVIFTEQDRALAAAPPMAGESAEAATFAPAVDWRNHNGNHVTSVKDQRNCGSCVSFCCTAVVESMASIESGQLLDLSEADSHFNSNHGASCGGWNADACLDQIKQRGVVSDAALPYMAAFDNPPQSDTGTHLWIPHVRPTPDRPASQVSITSHGLVSDVNARKQYLTDVGPCSASFDVYDDFFSYSSGVYHHVTGAFMGGHCVEVIGYSEAEKCWIAKNSWGTGWGMSGYFKIAYGECNFDTYAFATAQGVKLPATGPVWHGWESLGGDAHLQAQRHLVGTEPDRRRRARHRLGGLAPLVGRRELERVGVTRRWLPERACGVLVGRGTAGHLRRRPRPPALPQLVPGRLEQLGAAGRHALLRSGGGVLGSQPDRRVRPRHGLGDVAPVVGRLALGRLGEPGRCLDSGPAVASWAANRLDTFVKGTDSQLYHKWWNGSKWSDWEGLGGYLGGDPGAVSWGPNRIDVFYPGKSFHMSHKWWDGARWSGEEDLGGVLSSGAGVSSWSFGRLDTFVEGTDSALFHKWYA